MATSTFAGALLGLLVMPPAVKAQSPLGIDVSSYQGSAQNPPTNINWPTVKGSGIAFAYTKATEGVGYKDADLSYNMNNAKAAGVLIGAYHFARYDLNQGNAGADAEANYYWGVISNYAKGGGYYLMPMLDVEEANTSGLTKAGISQWANRWCQDIVNLGAASGVTLRPIIYTYTSYATSWLDNTVTNWPLWMAQYPGGTPNTQTSGPNTYGPWPTWQLWQYSSTNTIPGINGVCDVDVFNGTLAQMKLVIGISLITNQPASITIGQGSNVTLTVGGTNISHYQWALNGTNLAGATTSAYAVSNAQTANAGAYTVTVTNTLGTNASLPAILSVLPVLTNAPGAIVAPPNMVDWWPADGNAIDIFGTLTGTPQPQGGFYFSAGKNAQAFHFDGSTGYLSTGASSLAPPWTLSLWVNYTHTTQTSAALLEDGTNSIKLEQYGSATHNVGISQLGYADSVFNYAAPTGTWTHLAFVANSTSVTLYANGASQGALNTNNCLLPRAFIGAGHVTSTGRYIDHMLGSLDDLMIFSRALTSAEVSSIYNAGAGGLIRAPQITGAKANTNGQFVLSLKGFTGKNYTIYSSSNLLTWSTVGTVANANGTNSYTISNITNQPNMFYRVSEPY